MTTQIAVKLPDRLVEQLDQLVDDGGYESRSEAVRHAIAALLRGERRAAIDRSFEEGFRRNPDDSAVLDEARRLAIASIEEEPWERWW